MIFVNPSNYPKSDSFINNMPAESQERLLKCGWKISKTLFFEIPYAAVSGVGAGIVRDYRHQVYYKVFYATEAVIPTLLDLEIQVIVAHEQDEINKAANDAEHDSIEGPFVGFNSEIGRHEHDLHWIEERYGKEVARTAMQKVDSAIVSKPLIPRYMLTFWLSFFLMTHYDNFVAYSLPMNKAMLSERQREFFQQLIQEVVNKYEPGNAPKNEWMKLYLSANRSSYD